MTCKILILLVNTLAADEKYPVLNRDNLTIPIQIQLSEKQKNFSQFLTAFLKSRFNLKHFEKKMTLIEFVFPKLQTPKTWSEKCRESPVSEDLEKKHAKRAKALLKSLSQHLYYIHWSLRRQLSRKKSPLLTRKNLGLLLNKLAADEKYPVLNRDNLTIPIQMQLTKKQKFFSSIFTCSFES